MDLQRFAGSLTLTVTNDGHFSATSASPASSLAEGDKSTLTITPSSGYELDEIVVLSGGATVAYASDRLPGETVRAIVLDCSYPSPYHQMYAGKGAMALIWAPLMPLIRLFSKLFVHIDIKQPTSAALEKAAAPAFFIGGLADRKVPFSQFVMNYEACSSEKELLAVPNAPHAMAFAEADGQQIEKLFKFIDKFITDHQGGKHEH